MNISVIIPVYNAERYVRQAVESALAQPQTAEVLMIEDGSPDGALAVCEALAAEHPNRVRLLRHPGGENRGAGASRNLGLRQACEDVIAFLDADDFMLPDRFAKTVPLLEAEPSVDGVYEAVGTHFESAELRESGIYRGYELTTIPDPPPPEELFQYLLTGGRHFCTDGIVFRRSLLERTGMFRRIAANVPGHGSVDPDGSGRSPGSRCDPPADRHAADPRREPNHPPPQSPPRVALADETPTPQVGHARVRARTKAMAAARRSGSRGNQASGGTLHPTCQHGLAGARVVAFTAIPVGVTGVITALLSGTSAVHISTATALSDSSTDNSGSGLRLE